MTALGHMFFSISLLVVVYKLGIISDFITGDWLYMLIGVLFGSLLPDIDHPSSLIGKKFRVFSIPIFRLCGHRGFTHSLFAWLLIIIFISKVQTRYLLSDSVLIQAFLLGYFSHIVGDMLTIKGVPFLWPLKIPFRFPIIGKDNNVKRERFISICLIISACFIPPNFCISLISMLHKINDIFQ